MAFLVLIGALVIVGAILRLLHRDDSPASSLHEILPTDHAADSGEPEICCGLHEICSKSAQRAGEIVYFDDEELDRFAGRRPDDYTPEEEEEFREVLYTLLPSEVYLWGTSLTQRNVALPSTLRDEWIMMAGDSVKPESRD